MQLALPSHTMKILSRPAPFPNALQRQGTPKCRNVLATNPSPQSCDGIYIYIPLLATYKSNKLYFTAASSCSLSSIDENIPIPSIPCLHVPSMFVKSS